nr:PREDICTED: uncharacterized protein LOC107076037 [Lepisosteus oculatus]
MGGVSFFFEIQHDSVSTAVMNSRRTRPLEPGQTMLKQPSYSGVWAKRSPTWILLLILSSVSSEHVPVAAKFGDSVTLPCDGKPYSLGIPEDALHVFWETLDYRVYEFVGGKGYPDNGFQDRAEMSREKISQGDFSLTVHNTTFSDGQIYACYLLTESSRLLQSVDLLILARSEVHSLQSGASLSLPLHTAGPVEVLFDPGGSAQSRRVLLSRAGLPGPGYEQRVSVQNSSLTLRSLTPADQGNYTVRDLQGNTISTVIVTVGAHRDTVTLQPGASLSVPLFTGEPVEVLFDPAGGGNWTSVCSVQNSTARCVPQYRDRVSVQDGSLTLRPLTPADQGNYTVRDLQGNTISTVIVTVGGE